MIPKVDNYQVIQLLLIYINLILLKICITIPCSPCSLLIHVSEQSNVYQSLKKRKLDKTICEVITILILIMF